MMKNYLRPGRLSLAKKKKKKRPNFKRIFLLFILPVVTVTFMVYTLTTSLKELVLSNNPEGLPDSPQLGSPASDEKPSLEILPVKESIIESSPQVLPVAGGQTRMKEGDRTKDEALSGGSLPSAKSLLTKIPPFNDADIIKLSEQMITSPNTVVTAYFRVPSKFQPGKYDGWMRNMLSLQDAIVVFTHADLVPQIKELRSHALNRTVIIPLELDDLPIGTLYSKEFWQNQLDKDPEKNIHRSYELLWIWLSKTWCTTQAIRLNIFQSDLYVWSDIGCFRDKKYNSKTMIIHRENVPPHEVIQMAHHKTNPPEEELWADKYHHKEHYYHSGSQFAAYKDTMKQFHEYFLETIDRFLERNMFIGEDQHVLQSVCLQHPEICAYAPFDQVKDNHYFGLRWVGKYG
jgi:hypothetical protein